MFLTVNTELLTMLMTSLARDADALGSIKVEVEVVRKKGVPAKGIYFPRGNKSFYAKTKLPILFV